VKAFEIVRLAADPFSNVLQSQVRSDLRRLARGRLLDVGGRSSPYTIGLDAWVTVLDLARTSEKQARLNLGMTDELVDRLKARRSNIEQVVFEDMTKCSLPSATFSGVVCVEVLEHVEDHDAFIAQCHRVLQPGGWFYATTPNGDYIPVTDSSRDHVRHYRGAELHDLLGRYFERVEVAYGIRTGKNHLKGLRSLSAARPLRTIGTMAANWRHRRESAGLERQNHHTAHLFASAFKAS
jgi:2-polyprenyl-3-methyl-5-hydroxy-6-metoxy-1,4-benzoquinol methylase